MSTLAAIEARYQLTFPAGVAALYERTDGEAPGAFAWRLHSLAELAELELDSGWLAHSDDGAFIKAIGGVLPLFTNDGSDLLVLHVGGPLDGRLSLVRHDDSSIDVAFRSVESALAHRDAPDYASTERTADDLAAADQLVAVAQAKRTGALYADRNARALRNQPEVAPTYWRTPRLAHRLLFIREQLIASQKGSGEILSWDLVINTHAAVATAANSTALIHDAGDGAHVRWSIGDTVWQLAPGLAPTRAFAIPATHKLVASTASHVLVVTAEGDLAVRLIAADGASTEHAIAGDDLVYAFLVGEDLIYTTTRTVERLSLPTGNRVTLAEVPTRIYIARISIADQRLALGLDDGGLVVVDLRNNAIAAINPTAHDGIITGMALLPDGRIATGSSFDDSLRVHDGQLATLSRTVLARPSALVADPRGRLYVAFPYLGIARFDVTADGALAPVIDA